MSFRGCGRYVANAKEVGIKLWGTDLSVRYLTNRSILQCSHGGTILLLTETAASSYKATAATLAASCVAPEAATAAAARASYSALGANLTAASKGASAAAAKTVKVEGGYILTREDLMNRSVIVCCLAPKPCTQITGLFGAALAVQLKVASKQTGLTETPLLDTLASGSVTDGGGQVLCLSANQVSACPIGTGG